MRRAVSIMLIICLMGSARPVAAWKGTAATLGPIARAFAREVALFAVVQSSQPVDENWTRVRKLKPGTEVLVSTRSSDLGRRCVVSATESDLTVLNLTESLGEEVADVLRRVAWEHPEYFARVRARATFLLEKNVQLAPEGVLVAGRKVADLKQIIESITRADVVEIARMSGRSHPAANKGALIGVIAGVAASDRRVHMCHGHDLDLTCPMATAILGLVGAGIGALFGAEKLTESDVIYRAP